MTGRLCDISVDCSTLQLCGASGHTRRMHAGTEHLTHLYATAGDSAPGSAATSRAVSAVSSKVRVAASA